ncbi:hypothetical protein, partial [Novipirellula sp.]|uniref:hypothetical protein n=1 Tax=Novipirellula sp. TaxID=2795430 RepID=UPI003562B614
MESLIADGIVYMNTLRKFWETEDSGVRGDPLDTVHTMANGAHGEVRTPDGEKIPVEVTSWTLQTRPADPDSINLFCMYALRWDEHAPPIDDRVQGFGDTAVLFND